MLAPVPALLEIMRSLMPALVGIMLAPCCHFYYPQYFTLAEYRAAANVSLAGKNNRRKQDIRPLGQAPGRALGEPPHFWLDKNARGLSLSAEPK